MNRKNEIKIGIKGDPNSFKKAGAPALSRAEEVFESSPEKNVDPGFLISHQNHPVTLVYDGQSLILSPRGRVRIANKQKLAKLATGVVFVPEPALTK